MAYVAIESLLSTVNNTQGSDAFGSTSERPDQVRGLGANWEAAFGLRLEQDFNSLLRLQSQTS